MAQPTYSMTGIVLRKTKLGESDLIITMIGHDGSLRKGVAKGARKPTSPFAARLELYNKADLLCATGKSLDIIKEARLEFSGETLHHDMDKSMACACACELACRFAQPSLENPRLYEMTERFLRVLDDADSSASPALLAAYYLKCFSICGIRPSLDRCVSCGSLLDERTSAGGAAAAAVPEAAAAKAAGELTDSLSVPISAKAFSYEEGGYVCSSCSSSIESARISAATLLWANALLYSTFDSVCGMRMPDGAAFDILQLCQQWSRIHIGSAMKSLKMFMSLYIVL